MGSLEDESCAPYLKDGVWHSPFTNRPICRTPRTHPQRREDLRAHRQSRVDNPRYVCVHCDRDRRLEYKKSGRGPTRKRVSPSPRDPRPPESHPLTPTDVPRLSKQPPFDATLALLERQWNLPYSKWTRAHHLAHTHAMYKALGWGAQAITSSVIRQGRRVTDITKPGDPADRATDAKQGQPPRESKNDATTP